MKKCPYFSFLLFSQLYFIEIQNLFYNFILRKFILAKRELSHVLCVIILCEQKI